MLPTSFFPYWEYKLKAFCSFQRKEISDFFQLLQHYNKEQEKWCFFALCGWESRTYIKMYPLSKMALCPFLFTHVNDDSIEPFVSKNVQIIAIVCVELWFVCYCPLGAKKTPKTLSNTITNRMAWRRIQNLWARAVFSLWPLDRSGLCFKHRHFYVKKETASVACKLAHFQSVTHKVHKHSITAWSTL